MIFINEVVSNNVLLATDAWHAYEVMDCRRAHASVDYLRKQYVVGAVHTDTIGDFCSIFKRDVVGTLHKVGVQNMPLCVAEFQFPYNNRMSPGVLGAVIRGC